MYFRNLKLFLLLYCLRSMIASATGFTSIINSGGPVPVALHRLLSRPILTILSHCNVYGRGRYINLKHSTLMSEYESSIFPPKSQLACSCYASARFLLLCFDREERTNSVAYSVRIRLRTRGSSF